mgnify:CR=1 FL=1
MPAQASVQSFIKLVVYNDNPRVQFIRPYNSPDGVINTRDEGKIVDDDDESIVCVLMDDGKSCWIEADYLEAIE